MSKFSISDLDLYYDKGAFHALKNINLEIQANEILHLSDHPVVENLPVI